MTAAGCFHCNEPLPAGQSWTLHLDGLPRAFCCPACRLVAQTIHAGGLGDYYRLREAPGNRPEEETDTPDTPHPLDNPGFQQGMVQTEADGHCSARFAVDGLHCAACVWLIESHLAQLPGVDTALIHFGEQRLSLRWDPDLQTPGQLARAVETLGYRLTPWHPEQLLARQQQENRRSLIRLGIAGLAMMQTGMMATALYVGDFSQDMDTHWRDLFRWVSLLFALPVATWSAWPFYRNAINGLRQRTATMDLPVSIAIGGAFLASVVATVIGAEHVYFDSVTMFTFLLLGGRYLEMRIRHRNRQGSLVAGQTLPWQAHRLQRPELGSPFDTVPATAIAAADVLLVRPGEAVPVDGRILQGTSSLGEAILTGEPLPVVRGPGDAVLAGTLNHEQALVVRADGPQRSARIAQMQAQLEQALAGKPPIARLADRLAGHFVLVVLAVSVATAWYWWPNGADVAIAATLAVLVASCPCALSLATPTALTAATHALAGQGFLITRGHVLETLPRITHACFDKTGTLTEGTLRIERLVLTGRSDASRCRALAAALESGSDHPIARAFHAGNTGLVADALHYQAAAGVSGRIDGHSYRLGQPTFVGQTAPDTQQHWLGLTEDGQLLAWFALADNLRADAAAAIAALQAAGIRTSLLTGDASAEAARVAAALAIDRLHSGISPEGKQAHIRNGQAHGDVVMMVGDGVNDAAVLAAADVSVAMAGAAPLTRLQADVLLTRPQLDLLDRARRMAWRTRRIMRQNLAWSAGYNLLAMPLAAAGFLPPWLAAIGMSASSLLVMLNAGRLARP